ncbi:hypothetical protein A2T98_04040 [Nodularia spumigena CENA596]|uniref:Uncharacterized protein n=1 Tax=Nodularia spumigena CENA596 TaxID=1819295 RepID=A0A166KGK8_NODSP|nr:hypothetical protein [Nodularia spumigena]KZL51092.1 hypothetical protein A2T98_04040 [Nodularia spumigena CENA596]
MMKIFSGIISRRGAPGAEKERAIENLDALSDVILSEFDICSTYLGWGIAINTHLNSSGLTQQLPKILIYLTAKPPRTPRKLRLYVSPIHIELK